MNPEPDASVDLGHMISLVTLAVILIAAVYTEFRDKRIPNEITIPGILIGLLLGYLPIGIEFISSFKGLSVGFGFLFIFYMFGGMGGADVKLMGAVGALIGYPLILSAVVFTGLIGGAMAVLYLIWNGTFWRGLFSSLMLLGRWKRHALPDDEIEKEEETGDEEEDQGLGTIPYGIAIVVGSALAIFFKPV
jgi:prepilin peptidase CpaA